MYDNDSILDDFNDPLEASDELLQLEDVEIDEEEMVDSLLEDEIEDEESDITGFFDERLLELEASDTWSDDPVRMYLT